MSESPIQYLIHPQGLPIRVVQWGLSGPAVLLLHGLGSRAEAWRRVAPLLAAQGYRCLALDTPGHGLSYKGAGFDYTAAGHARLLTEICDLLGEEKVDLAASSLGGLWAAAFGASYPERLRSLTLIGSIGLQVMTPERCQWTADYLKDMRRDSIRARFHRGVADPGVFDEAYIEETWRVNNSAGAAESFAILGRYYLEGINDDVQLEGLAAAGPSLPLLLIWGKEDPTTLYDIALHAIERLPWARLCAITDTKHMPQLEQPQITYGQMLRHISSGTLSAPLPPAPQVEMLGAAALRAAG